MEIWKDIKNYEGLYQISDKGNVKSLERIWICGKGSKRHNGEKNMKQHPISSGYMRVCLSKNGKDSWFMVHRLVADAFIPNPDNLPQINHKDECKSHNSVDNIEWCDAKYNINYGNRTKKTSKPIEAIDDNGNIKYQFPSKSEARRNGFADSNITKCINGEIGKAYGLKWRYKDKNESAHESTLILN